MDSLSPDFWDFWGGWAAGLTLLGLIGLAWLAWSVYSARAGSVKPPEQTWDETLREGNAPPPKWWFFALFAALIFSAAYMLLYPGFGNFPGFLHWNQRSQLESGMAHYRAQTAATHQRWETAPLAELRADGSAMASARRLFANHCAACHGENARGQAGLFPDLTDDKWHWGGGENQIMQSLTNGRVAVMPPWGALGEESIEQLADYVLTIADGNAAGSEDGGTLYATNCAVCHGPAGQGNPALGAPGFGGKWLYLADGGDVKQAVMESIRHGRQGIMPAQKDRLRPPQIRVLAAWLSGGIKLAPPRN